jgi:hypothetical protein
VGKGCREGAGREKKKQAKQSSMRTAFITLLTVFTISCNSPHKGKKVVLTVGHRTNSARLGDTLLIYETACKGCPDERSTHFKIVESENIVKLDRITTDDDNFTGGSITKRIYLIPIKRGKTKLELYKIRGDQPTEMELTVHDVYNIEIKN